MRWRAQLIARYDPSSVTKRAAQPSAGPVRQVASGMRLEVDSDTALRSVEIADAEAFGSLGLNRIVIRAAVDNLRSRAVPERLGFVQEGVLREAEKHSDRFVDLVCYSLLRREYGSRKR